MGNPAIYLTVIYLLTYRLAVLLLGGVSIYLGYRLFIEGFSREGGSQGEMSAKFGTVTLTLKNATPGIFFAIFGVAITTVILMGTPPEFNYNVVRDRDAGIVVEEGWKSKGGTPNQNTPSQTDLTNAAQMHEQIWKVHFPKALLLAERVIKMDPIDPNYRDTLAMFYFANNDYLNAAQQQNISIENAKKNSVTQDEILKLERKLEVYKKFIEHM